MAGAPIGNNNATKTKKWTYAINKALKQYNDGDIKAGHALDAIARKLVKQALTGTDQQFKEAIAVIGDRIEGKPAQLVEVSGELATGVTFNMSIQDTKK